MSNLTRILSEINSGDPSAAEKLLPLVYDELRKLAAAKLAHEKPGQTLQATALVHEAYLRLLGNEHDEQRWDSRGHFFSAAAEAMRRILVERARQAKAQKRGGGEFQRVDLDVNLVLEQENVDERLLQLDIALDRLRQTDAVKAELVQLRYFAGLTGSQAAQALRIGESTADKYWAYAKAWLRSEMHKLAEETCAEISSKNSRLP